MASTEKKAPPNNVLFTLFQLGPIGMWQQWPWFVLRSNTLTHTNTNGATVATRGAPAPPLPEVASNPEL